MMNYINHASKMTGRRLLVLSALFTLSSISWASSLNTTASIDTPDSSSSAKTTIELPLQGVTLEYKTDVRLLQVLDDANANSNIGYFPLSAQLFDKTNTDAIDAKTRNVLNQLKVLAVEEPEANLVRQQLASFQYLNRIFIELDRNVVISQSDKNPSLILRSNTSEQLSSSATQFSIKTLSTMKKAPASQTQAFSLYLPKRPTSIQLMGVMKEPVRMKLIEHGTLNDYLDALPNGFIGESVDKSVAYVVQPNGVVQTIQYAYWNEQPVYLAPGAIVFMAFYALPSEFSMLNKDIVDLLRHKVGL
ncbi:capsule biosynthesis GfcC family protein [Vibrio crassostreae]|uniref:capsule biosynthesis GfcC family protein n=1 Tax=Vibrio crassostreae TaxID=246167 RepID=UPI001B3015DE|nr:capsule biosynthesis GfcC family protein [Vibrio crassostreae]